MAHLLAVAYLQNEGGGRLANLLPRRADDLFAPSERGQLRPKPLRLVGAPVDERPHQVLVAAGRLAEARDLVLTVLISVEGTEDADAAFAGHAIESYRLVCGEEEEDGEITY